MKKKMSTWKIVVIIILIFFIGAMVYTAYWSLKISSLKNNNPQSTVFTKSCEKVDLKWVSLSDVAPVMKKGIQVAEDPRFYEHSGIDLKLIKSSIKRNIRDMKPSRGGSTITMQVIKNLYLGPRKTIWRKVEEIYLAVIMNQLLSKDRILEIYLNVIQLGKCIFGVQLASEAFFNKNSNELDIHDASYLISIMPNPNLLNSGYFQGQFNVRRALVYMRLKGLGFK